ncbi:MAG: alpha/beta hydrolase family protein [Vicinamibacterales bacterium]
MLARFFHAWEHQLASVSKDRIVRPFEWGLDWFEGADVHAASPEDELGRLVAEVMADSQAFFSVPETDAYEFEPASPELAAQGEAGTLRFESALRTPHEENNRVSARWFPAAGHGPKRAVLVLPQWNSDAGGHIGLCRILARFGVSALRLSLPYHDVRMPPELSRADYIVSSNIGRTLQVCRQAVLDARRAVGWLSRQGYERIGILGTSLGSCLSLLTAAHEPRIRAQALNHVSPWFADVVWRGLSTRHVRAGLEGHITLDQLRTLWLPISPFAHLERVRDTRTLLVYARYDLTFPVDLSLALIDEFGQRHLPHEVAVLPCGHYTTGRPPFAWLDAWVLTRFLRRAL